MFSFINACLSLPFNFRGEVCPSLRLDLIVSSQLISRHNLYQLSQLVANYISTKKQKKTLRRRTKTFIAPMSHNIFDLATCLQAVKRWVVGNYHFLAYAENMRKSGGLVDTRLSLCVCVNLAEIHTGEFLRKPLNNILDILSRFSLWRYAVFWGRGLDMCVVLDRKGKERKGKEGKGRLQYMKSCNEKDHGVVNKSTHIVKSCL